MEGGSGSSGDNHSLFSDHEMNSTETDGQCVCGGRLCLITITVTVPSPSELQFVNQDHCCSLLRTQIFVWPFRETRSCSQCMNWAQSWELVS